jgi:predicted DsbA family dithiol-disulfide isomerase
MIGKVPLDQLAKDRDLVVEWKAFELRPEGTEIPPMPPEYLARARASVEALAKKYGIQMVWHDKSKYSRLALEGSKFAEEQGLGNEYHDAVFSAQYLQEKNINDIEVLVSIAKQIGLNPGVFRDALSSRKFQQEVLQDCEEAHKLGIQSIPCFIVENRAIFGAQGYEALERLLNGKGFSVNSLA